MEEIEYVEDLARLDIHRARRTGIPEVIYGEGKNPPQIIKLLKSMAEKTGIAIATHIPPRLSLSKKNSPKNFELKVYPTARMMIMRRRGVKRPKTGGVVAVLAAGTADIPVAEEARVTAEVLGCKALPFYDVGVAGMHRLIEPISEIIRKGAHAVVAVAGMEGVLPTVVKSLINLPVIGVPTSIGYGYGGKGECALMTMLQSCSPGLVVVNIDNGFGAGATAALIANQVARAGKSASLKAKK